MTGPDQIGQLFTEISTIMTKKKIFFRRRNVVNFRHKLFPPNNLTFLKSCSIFAYTYNLYVTGLDQNGQLFHEI